MSTIRGRVYEVFLEALDRGLISESQRERAFTLLGTISPDQADPQLLVEKGLLTQDQLGDLLSSATDQTVRLSEARPAPPAPTPRTPTPRTPTPRTPAPRTPAPKTPPALHFLGAAGEQRYEILGEIGRGGMGVVYKARDRSLGRIIAIKVLPEARGFDDEEDMGFQRFRREAQAAARLAHPNIVQVHDVVLTEGFPYFTMQFIEGRDLDSMLGKGALPLHVALPIFIKVARAIAAAHKLGIIHRDIKPSNVIVDAEGEPHVTDFGLAKDLSDAVELTTAGMVMGTPAYMAPEQFGGKAHQVDARSDVFALGATLYHMVVGKPPYGGGFLREAATPPREVDPAIPPGIEAVILKALGTKQAERYQTVAEMVADTEAIFGPSAEGEAAEAAGVELAIERADIAAFEADVVAFEEARGFAAAAASVALKLGKSGIGLGTLIPDADGYRCVGTSGSIPAGHALFVEVGSRSGFRYAKMREFSVRVLETLAQEAPDARHVAMTTQGVAHGLDESEALAAQLAGFHSAIRAGQFPQGLERITLVDTDTERVSRLRDTMEQMLAEKDWARRSPEGKCYILTQPARSTPSILQPGDAQLVSDSSWLNPENKPVLFVAMGSRQDIQDVFHYGIRATAHASGFLCERLDDQPLTADTLIEIRAKIDKAALMVADLTSAPPIVFVELGYAWARRCPVVLLLKGTQQLPFGLGDNPCITYGTIQDVETALAKELAQLRGSRFA